MILDDIAVTYLPAQGLGLVFGTNLFAGILPDQPDAAVAVDEYPGMAPTQIMGVDPLGIPAMEHPKIQVVVRGEPELYLVPRALIESIYRKLNLVTNATINGTYYERIEPVQSPFLMHRDNSRRSYFACNFQVTRSPTS